MKFLERIRARRAKDAELERMLGVRKHDPVSERYGPVYSPDDIRRLEEERLPWLRKRRRA